MRLKTTIICAVILCGFGGWAIATRGRFLIAANPTHPTSPPAVHQTGQSPFTRSQPTDLPALRQCNGTASVSLSKQLTLDKCRIRNTWKNGLFTLKKNGKEIGKWATVSSIMQFEFDAFMADLDGDGSQELVIANHDNTSNGIGIRYWTIYIFSDPSTHLFQQPLRFGVVEYGKQGVFIADGTQFEIWTTDWSGGVVGQQWLYRNGQLQATDHPILKRWLSFNFQAERGKTFNSPKIPYLWLANPKVQAHTQHPLFQEIATVSVEEGVIQSVGSTCIDMYRGCRDETSITFKSAKQDKPQSYLYGSSSTYEEPNGKFKYFRYFGDRLSGRTYPDGYLPSNPTEWLKNRRCQLITYKQKRSLDSSVLRILWLM